MQFDSQRAFPYPVLRPDVDDYVEGDIQVTVEFQPSQDGQEVTATAHFLVSVPELVHAIEAGDAAYVLTIACRDTYYRHVVSSGSKDFILEFPQGALRGEVQVSPYITAKKSISGYTCAWINPEFGSGPFSFEVGSVLAIDQPQYVYIDRDVFRPLSSVFVLVRDEALVGHEWKLSTEEDKVQIKVSSELKEKIDAARNSKSHRAVLMNSIYFAAVMQCVVAIRKDGTDQLGRWAKVIEQKCHNLNIEIDSHDEYLVAERLMKSPFKLIDAYVFAGGEE